MSFDGVWLYASVYVVAWVKSADELPDEEEEFVSYISDIHKALRQPGLEVALSAGGLASFA